LHDRQGVTDTDGRALLRHILPGTYSIEGSLLDHDGEVALAAGELRTVEVEAVQKSVVSGRVVDHEGRSVGGARLWLSASMNWHSGWEAGRSDASGAFAVPVRGFHYLGAQMDGHVPSYLQSFDASRGSFGDVVLQLRGTAAQLHGTVHDAHGKPVAWATVRVGVNGGGAVESGMPSVRFNQPNPEQLTTDEDGKFAATGVPPGDVPLWVWAPGFGLLRQSVAVTPGKVETIDLTLPDAAVVTGIVRDAAGQPVAKAGIRFGDEFMNFPQAYAQADEAGRFRLDNLPAWPTGVELVAGRGTIKSTARLQLTAGTTTEWNPVLDNGRTIRGAVLGPGDRPPVGAKVGVVHPSYQRVQRWFETGADGTFELQQVGDKPCNVQVAQGETVLREVRAVAPDTRDLVLRVSERDLPTARVRGRILDTSGRPARGSVNARRGGVTSGEDLTLDATTGAFAFGPMPAASYRLIAFTEESGQVLLGTFELLPNEDRVLDDFVLLPTGDLEFTVLDAAGQPVDTTNVHLRTEAGATLGAGILERGKGKATKLQPGRYLVEVHFDKRRAPEVMTADVEVRSGTTTSVEIRGRAGVQVRIAFRDLAPADPECSVLVVCRSESGQLAGIFSTYPQNPEPLVQRSRLPPGRYQLDCRVSDGRRVAAVIDIAAGEKQSQITIDLPAR
jgi:protocatechuate 3,4-dioxygenase beta subunit